MSISEEQIKELRVDQLRKEQIEKEIEEEVDQICQNISADVGELKELPHNSTFHLIQRAQVRQMVMILRGFKSRIEQLGANITQMSSLAHQAWDATQVTIEASVQQSMKANKAAQALKDKLAQSGESVLRHVASSIKPEDFGYTSKEKADQAFRMAIITLKHQAQVAAAMGQANTPETQAKKILNELMTKHTSDLATLPGVKDALIVKKGVN